MLERDDYEQGAGRPLLDGDLAGRFARAVVEAGGDARHASAALARLTKRYAEPHRRYHTVDHVEACLTWLDWFAGSADHPEEVELALFFHDAVYEIGSSSNESESASLARAELDQLGVRTDAIERIAKYVEATAHREAEVTSGDAALVLDLDLTILGEAADGYDAFERTIREEYAQVPDDVFLAARRRILNQFLARGVIYRVRAVRDQLEARARDNLRRRLTELG
jgi:predicted metal-dependent HD superfamily phosphohydrolase